MLFGVMLVFFLFGEGIDLLVVWLVMFLVMICCVIDLLVFIILGVLVFFCL